MTRETFTRRWRRAQILDPTELD